MSPLPVLLWSNQLSSTRSNMLEFEEQPIVKESVGLPGGSGVQHFRELYVGAGVNRLICNQEGFSIGAETWADAPFRVDWDGNTTLNSLVIVGSTIRAGQTAYNTGTGYWIGVDSGTPKFSIGNGSTEALMWDGTTLTVRGTLNADDITAGTLTGRTVKAVGTGSASDVWLDGAVGEVSFYYDGTKIADLYSDTSGRVLLSSSSQSVYITAGTDFYCSGNNWFAVSNSDLTSVFNDNGGSDSARWINDSSLTMEHDDGGDLTISGSYF
jgi:hypothetical protein